MMKPILILECFQRAYLNICFRSLLIIAFMAIAGCSPAVNRVYLLPERLPPHSEDHPIRLYYDQEPECPYQEIGIVTSRQRNRFVSMDAVTEALRKEARKMGGDAVIHITLGDKAMGAALVGKAAVIDHDPVMKGSVVRWKDWKCKY